MPRIIKGLVSALAIVALGLVTGLVFMGGGVSAHDPAGTANDPKLIKFTSAPQGSDATAEVGFKGSPVGDAPGSPEGKALRLTNFEDTGISYAGVDPENVAINGKALADVNRISFKTRGYSGAGAPRVSVELSNGHFVYLSALYCQTTLDPTVWRKTQFMSESATCTIYTNTTSYSSTPGVQSAWSALVAGEGGGVTIDDIYLVHDEGPSVTWVDDLRFGSVLFAGPNVTTHNH